MTQTQSKTENHIEEGLVASVAVGGDDDLTTKEKDAISAVIRSSLEFADIEAFVTITKSGYREYDAKVVMVVPKEMHGAHPDEYVRGVIAAAFASVRPMHGARLEEYWARRMEA